jgi:hypothetical protein
LHLNHVWCTSILRSSNVLTLLKSLNPLVFIHILEENTSYKEDPRDKICLWQQFIWVCPLGGIFVGLIGGPPMNQHVLYKYIDFSINFSY